MNLVMRTIFGAHLYGTATPTSDMDYDECEALSARSTLPANVDREWWDNWLLGVIEEEIDNDSSKT